MAVCWSAGSLDGLDFGAFYTVVQRGAQVAGKALELVRCQEPLQAVRGLEAVMLFAREGEFDEREYHGVLQVGAQLARHLPGDEIVDGGHLEERAGPDILLPLRVPEGDVAVGHRRHHSLDDGDDGVPAGGHHAHLHNLACAGLQLEVDAIQADQLALACQVVGHGDRLAAVIIVHHVKAVSAGEQGKDVSRLTRKQIRYGACDSCHWQERQ